MENLTKEILRKFAALEKCPTTDLSPSILAINRTRPEVSAYAAEEGVFFNQSNTSRAYQISRTPGYQTWIITFPENRPRVRLSSPSNFRSHVQNIFSASWFLWARFFCSDTIFSRAAPYGNGSMSAQIDAEPAWKCSYPLPPSYPPFPEPVFNQCSLQQLKAITCRIWTRNSTPLPGIEETSPQFTVWVTVIDRTASSEPWSAEKQP